MVKRTDRLEQFEREELKKLKLTPKEAFRIFDELYQLVRNVGSLGRSDLNEDLKAEVRIAKMINHRSR
ncbi:MAG: hypothetical protein HYZ90_05495 [Candidatus Omnitrophica bacterium]|nr:hypothetical protein [Candidatus Omnitrophota bacterium]